MCRKQELSALLAQAFASEDSWLDGVRGALAAMLAFLDSETALASPGVVASLLEQMARTILDEGAPEREPNVRQGVAVPAALRDPRAHRARRAVCYLAEQGGRGLGPSNREIADGIGVARHEQISKLLARLADIGLLVKHAPGRRGHSNAWSLTPYGLEVARALQAEARNKVS